MPRTIIRLPVGGGDGDDGGGGGDGDGGGGGGGEETRLTHTITGFQQNVSLLYSIVRRSSRPTCVYIYYYYTR